MRKIWLIAGLIVGAWLLAACSRERPDIAVETAQHDFGMIQQGAVATTEIAIHNNGQGDLKIESLTTSCGCTVAQVEPRTISPGGEGRLSISYDSGYHPDRGAIKRYIFIVSNDPDEQEFRVIIQADVQEPTS